MLYLCVGEGETVTDQLPLPGQTIAGGSQVVLYLSEPAPQGQVTLPDFTAMTVAQANDAAANAGVYIQAVGNPDLTAALTVCSQEPAAGTVVDTGSMVKLRFTDPRAAD